MVVNGVLGSLPDWAAAAAAAYDPLICFESPFASFNCVCLRSQRDLSSSSKAGVLSSSMEAVLGKLNDLLLGVEQEGSSNYQLKGGISVDDTGSLNGNS